MQSKGHAQSVDSVQSVQSAAHVESGLRAEVLEVEVVEIEGRSRRLHQPRLGHIHVERQNARSGQSGKCSRRQPWQRQLTALPWKQARIET